jgi:methionine biosynthesis protein MetW
MDPATFYKQLWSVKNQAEPAPVARRDVLHRWLLDPIFDPAANGRHQVAIEMLGRGERFLDIGCWDGAFLESVRGRTLFEELHGIDIGAEMIESVRRKGFVGQVVDMNRDLLPFPSAHFDAITMLAVLEHVFDPVAAIREVHRVLRPGGTLIIDVPNVGSFSNRLRILAGRIPVTSLDPGWDGGHLHYFTKRDFDRFLRRYGFEILRRKTSGGHPALRERWISLLAGELIYQCRRAS